jgi:23S rRNA pseudouridine2605 synthase
MPAERLQKIMAAAGIASRRKAEEIIAAGRVTLNGKVVTEQGTKAEPEVDVICVDGHPIVGRQRLLYYLLNKPKGYVTTVSDPEGRPTVMELIPKRTRVSGGAA